MNETEPAAATVIVCVTTAPVEPVAVKMHVPVLGPKVTSPDVGSTEHAPEALNETVVPLDESEATAIAV